MFSAPFTREVPHISYVPAIRCSHEGCTERFVTGLSVNQVSFAWTHRSPDSKWTCDAYGKVLCPGHSPNAPG
jgi:hypothetical protein